ncbi:MAG: amino acid ABC transporter ATP-binding protein [Lachnospiraceae bacterium]|uniref:Amino acid ABC transporter ATP-binding protein n=1 Tax=Candidatus Weimeria bifida TaxID=2599074 RepID=A0A6N7IXN2_9FIRM|nr:amino acid ABC transporter ATP-binding protein [Candidatus Weimeria bifida]RRF95203.1 MAG: amino acid ABC transporter ATP-binding protein [Lachnospiraceae bacterium]
MVSLNNIYKHFGENNVLNGVNIDIRKGDVVVILGPSGSGKTTLLRCINFLERADQGTITIDNYTVSSKEKKQSKILALRRKTAMVFQQYNLFRNRTAVENVMEGLRVVKKVPKAEARKKAEAALDKVGLLDKADFYPAQLSGGQQQRIGIARALVMEPDLILFDEPTSALDPELVGEVLSCIRDVAKTGITMIVVTHEIAFAKEAATRVIFMEGGVVVEDGTPDQLINHPENERTQQFLARINGAAASA